MCLVTHISFVVLQNITQEQGFSETAGSKHNDHCTFACGRKTLHNNQDSYATAKTFLINPHITKEASEKLKNKIQHNINLTPHDHE
jgi:hypothetical protein